MALAIQTGTFMHQYVYSWMHPTPSKSPDALKLGVLSSAQIDAAGIIHPAETHPSVILYAIASRDLAHAQNYKKQYRFTKAHGSYAALVDDPEVDVIYISVPNAMHYEWASKALRAGKHVLCEKPFTSNADEAKRLVQLGKETGLVVEEAFHWQFHPASHAFRKILDSGEYGRIIRTEAVMTGRIPDGDIRWKFDLAGGSAMDMTYALSFTRFALHAQTPAQINSATARPLKADPRVDEAMHTHLIFEGPKGNQVNSKIYTEMARKPVGFGLIPRFWELPYIEVETERAVIYYYNAMMPHVYHYIAVSDKVTGQTKFLKQYSGGPFWGNRDTSSGGKGGSSTWSTYRWQLEAFVDAVKGNTPAFWVPGDDTIWQMQSLDAIYRAAGLPVRPSMGLKHG